MIYDLIIIGLGPAGVSAAIYAKRAGLKVLCFEKAMVGGYLNFIDRIENYPGLYGVAGPDFAFNLQDTITKLAIDVKQEQVTHIVDDEVKKIYVKDKEYLCKYIIIATGRVPRNLGLKNEKELEGRGISRCALCDGNFYKNKDVAVIGGGASALQEALYLSNLCHTVYLVHRNDHFRVVGDLVKKVYEKANIKIIFQATVKELCKDDGLLKGIVLSNEEKLHVEGLFVYIGFVPEISFIKDLNITNEEGYILVDSNYETSKQGIYAVGDIIYKEIYQVSTGVSDGAVAATKVIDKCNGK